jgi:hypothetical protein
MVPIVMLPDTQECSYWPHDYFGGKFGTYHWNEVIDVDGRLAGHKSGNPDA